MFNLEKAIRIAKYSEIIYKGYSDMCDIIGIPDGGNWQYFDRKARDTQAMIVIDQKQKDMYIIFRGTTSPQDWLTDASCEKIDTVFGGVHKGIFEAYHTVLMDIEGVVSKLFSADNNYNVWTGGHSMGGGLATWCANRMSVIVGVKAIAGVYTFGSMKIFDGDGAEKYNRILGAQTYRIVHGCDMVTYLPTGKYHHVEDLVYIDTKDNILVDEEGSKEGLKRMMWDKFREGIKNACTFQLFRKGHEMRRYVSSLEQGKVK